ncbi:MAG: alkaline phosphatase PhoX [Gammaproteobacteria bacterium]
MTHDRRRFLRHALFGSTSLGLACRAWPGVFAASASAPGPYGELGAPDGHGIRLPAGFSARLLATSNAVVAGTGYAWHMAPDGGATFAADDGGWVYVSNSERDSRRGGASALRFDAAGHVAAAYRVLGGTDINCAGGPTPWGTWLSCEEHPRGLVWECDPFRPGQGVARPALGVFTHEAAAIDPATGYVYLTEDTGDSRLYRFRPTLAGQLTDGVLEAATVGETGQVTWRQVSPSQPCRVRGTAEFKRGEGACFHEGVLYFCTTADDRVWALDTARDRLAIVYDAARLGAGAALRNPDNITVHRASGDLYVAEDPDDLQLVLLADHGGERVVAPFLQLVGHDGSEITGPAFSPDGRRVYFSSQRGTDGDYEAPGMTFEVSGPFRSDA